MSKLAIFGLMCIILGIVLYIAAPSFASSGNLGLSLISGIGIMLFVYALVGIGILMIILAYVWQG